MTMTQDPASAAVPTSAMPGPAGAVTPPVLIEARGLARHYPRGSEIVRALDGVDLTIRSGEMVAILGPSGSGKTTLINLLSVLDAPDAGSLRLQDREVTGADEDTLVEARKGCIGYVFQKFLLLPTLTVAENVELPLVFLRRPIDRAATRQVLAEVGLADRADHLPRELSGGQMQRTAIARALVTTPRLLIADEPTGNLDKANGEAIFALFRRLIADKGLAVVVTTHNLALAAQADRIIHLEDGRILREEPGNHALGNESSKVV